MESTYASSSGSRSRRFGCRADTILIDELGKTALASPALRAALADLGERDTRVVATVHAFRHPFADALEARPDAEVVLTRQNRDELPRLLAPRLRAADDEQRAT